MLILVQIPACPATSHHGTFATLLVLWLHLISTRPRRIRLTRKSGSFCQSSLFPLFGLYLSHTFTGTLQTSPGSFLGFREYLFVGFFTETDYKLDFYAML